jgi:hypothetical protein
MHAAERNVLAGGVTRDEPLADLVRDDRLESFGSTANVIESWETVRPFCSNRPPVEVCSARSMWPSTTESALQTIAARTAIAVIVIVRASRSLSSFQPAR